MCGTNHSLFSANALFSQYGLKATANTSESAALAALAAGKPVIGGEVGHILALIPPTEEELLAGYKFRIMDSGCGYDGLYRSSAEANLVLKKTLKYYAIVEKL